MSGAGAGRRGATGQVETATLPVPGECCRVWAATGSGQFQGTFQVERPSQARSESLTAVASTGGRCHSVVLSES